VGELRALAGGALFAFVEDEGAFQSEVHDEVGRGMRAVSAEQVGNGHASGEVVIALLFTAPVGVVDYIEWLHALDIGKSAPFLKRELSSQSD